MTHKYGYKILCNTTRRSVRISIMHCSITVKTKWSIQSTTMWNGMEMELPTGVESVKPKATEICFEYTHILFPVILICIILYDRCYLFSQCVSSKVATYLFRCWNGPTLCSNTHRLRTTFNAANKSNANTVIWYTIISMPEKLRMIESDNHRLVPVLFFSILFVGCSVVFLSMALVSVMKLTLIIIIIIVHWQPFVLVLPDNFSFITYVVYVMCELCKYVHLVMKSESHAKSSWAQNYLLKAFPNGMRLRQQQNCRLHTHHAYHTCQITTEQLFVLGRLFAQFTWCDFRVHVFDIFSIWRGGGLVSFSSIIA